MVRVEHVDGEDINKYDALGALRVYTDEGLASVAMYSFIDNGEVMVTDEEETEYILCISGNKPMGIAAGSCYLHPKRIRRWEADFTSLRPDGYVFGES